MHCIYYNIKGDKPVDFSHDKSDLDLDFKDIMNFYVKTKYQRSKFSEKYALYYLLKRKGYPVTLEDDFPDIKYSRNTEKVCKNFFSNKDKLYPA